MSKKKPTKKDKNKRKRKEMAAKKQISIEKNCLVVCLFFQMDGFFSLFTLLQVNYADMVHA